MDILGYPIFDEGYYSLTHISLPLSDKFSIG
jgi:hypothetical protein